MVEGGRLCRSVRHLPDAGLADIQASHSYVSLFEMPRLWGTGKIALRRTPPLNLANEAHLTPAGRTMALVRYMPAGKRRSHAGRAIFLGCLLLNELRGLFVVAVVLKAWHG